MPGFAQSCVSANSPAVLQMPVNWGEEVGVGRQDEEGLKQGHTPGKGGGLS